MTFMAKAINYLGLRTETYQGFLTYIMGNKSSPREDLLIITKALIEMSLI